jgi:hypothetical protein
MVGFRPTIHVFFARVYAKGAKKTWMLGTSPSMTMMFSRVPVLEVGQAFPPGAPDRRSLSA